MTNALVFENSFILHYPALFCLNQPKILHMKDDHYFKTPFYHYFESSMYKKTKIQTVAKQAAEPINESPVLFKGNHSSLKQCSFPKQYFKYFGFGLPYNQMKISKTLLLAILMLAQMSVAIQIGATHDLEHQFCWKDSYGRGVGTIPSECGKRQKIGLLCYDHCPSGYKRFGFDCHQNCLHDFRDDGLFCRKAQYGRGGGYPWKFGDGLNDHNMYRRCEADNGKGKCQKWGLVVYPKCKRGYYAAGCCICRPPKPDCKKLGYNGGIDLSCAKKIKIGTPYTAQCPADKQYDAGLCYKRCDKHFYGVGPVCWSQAPEEWVDCGMGAAKSKQICADIIISQIASIGQLAMNIFSLGSSGGASVAVGTVKNAGKIAKLKKQLDTLKKAIKESKNIGKVVKAAKKVKKAKKAGQKIKESYEKAADAANAIDQLNQMEGENVTEEDIVRISAQIAALADPTGVASIVEAYTHPKCSKIFHD